MAGKSSSLRQPRRGREVVPGQRAPPAHGPVLVVALHLAHLDALAAPPRPTTVPVPPVAHPPAVPPPHQRNPRMPLNVPQKRASLPARTPLCLPRGPPALAPVPAPALAPVPDLALVLALLTASAKGCV